MQTLNDKEKIQNRQACSNESIHTCKESRESGGHVSLPACYFLSQKHPLSTMQVWKDCIEKCVEGIISSQTCMDVDIPVAINLLRHTIPLHESASMKVSCQKQTICSNVI